MTQVENTALNADRDVWRRWLQDDALPLWSRQGFDVRRQLFHERLTFEREPVLLPELRLMVQARQIATFCRADKDGLASTASLALDCLGEVQRRYWHGDGASGWLFSLGPDGRPADRRRDLYAHAFILLAYAWAYRLSGAVRYLDVARQTVLEIDRIFFTQNGGYVDTVPAQDTVRRQNPHMHLLEAYLALAEASGDDFYLDYARRMIHLATRYFVLPDTGMLLEFFDVTWRPLQAPGHNRVEPGHLFEWAWLFGEFARLAPDDRDSEAIAGMRQKLYATAVAYGVDPDTAIVCDAITETGQRLEDSTRIWPQTEFMRMLCWHGRHGDAAARSMLSRQSVAFFKSYAPASLRGGWIDRIDVHGVSLTDYMPASSLYHIYGAAAEYLATVVPSAEKVPSI
ncbi:mannose-6-phosphate isomerase [Neoasaia chiangmaiensis NBRC 101099]|uniref:Mannose-6-phosphate isomerase n=1 Tax=Neoasaia chiangmaiensis TaxID=320497 RepID=A0A1U9KNC4_9PROT|nr:AGE family epimerase/isomerase [Neoasaia chiangmaiensis]AQS87311.1 mannose-6-phosphate isomerase [Neoasaia chiangmaiensis]GBR38627.1 mannose-6-phosphate isomerase [Neoasaia chiangmaiensis NBRC 101099]GEN15811.1 hypothetical protein NCH01_22420 [Neoasaia chiangmaiensis]